MKIFHDFNFELVRTFFSYAILQQFKFTLKIIWEEKTTFPHFCGFMKYESSWERYITIIGVCIHIRKSGWCTVSMFTRLYVHTCQIWSIWLTSWFPQKFKTPTKSSRWKTKLIVRQFECLTMKQIFIEFYGNLCRSKTQTHTQLKTSLSS